MRTVVITRPRHPLEGQRLPLLGQMRRHGRLELLLVLPDGSKSLIPAGWTDVESTGDGLEPVTVGTLADLQDAVGLVAALLARLDQPEVQAGARHPPSQEDDRAACTAEFAAGPGAGASIEPARPAARARGRGRDRRARPADRHRRPDERGSQR